MKGDVTVYSADLVVPMTAPPIPRGAVAVEDGRILHVGERRWVLDALEQQDVPFLEQHWSGALLPGLINAHSHLQYTGMAEVGSAQYSGFDDWADAFTESYERPHDWRQDALAGAAQSIRFGVSSVADVVTDIAAADALEASGLHGIAYWEVMNWETDAWNAGGRDRVIAELDRIPSTPGAGLSPHAPYSLDTVPLLDMPDIVRQRGQRLHIHLGESALEAERVDDGAEPTYRAWHFLGCRVSAPFGRSASAPARPSSSTGWGSSGPTATWRTACT